MNLAKKYLIFAFIICFLSTLLMPVLFPRLRLMYFIPFLIILYYQRPFVRCLWYSFFCGLIIDLLSAQPPFGFYACNYTLATAIIYHQKRNFFADHLSTLPIMTFLFSCTLTILEVIFLNVFGLSMSLSWQWVFADLLILPAGDAIFAFLCFILIPMSLRRKPKRRHI